MRLSSIWFGIASATATAMLWVVCSLLVVVLPGFMTHMTAGMMHGDTASMALTMTWPGFLWGLVAWVVWAGMAGWLLAMIYNRLLPPVKH
jgi:hypothetical protein